MELVQIHVVNATTSTYLGNAMVKQDASVNDVADQFTALSPVHKDGDFDLVRKPLQAHVDEQLLLDAQVLPRQAHVLHVVVDHAVRALGVVVEVAVAKVGRLRDVGVLRRQVCAVAADAAGAQQAPRARQRQQQARQTLINQVVYRV